MKSKQTIERIQNALGAEELTSLEIMTRLKQDKKGVAFTSRQISQLLRKSLFVKVKRGIWRNKDAKEE